MTATVEEIRARRAKLGLSQFELAIATGYTPATIAAMECGVRKITPRFLMLLELAERKHAETV